MNKTEREARLARYGENPAEAQEVLRRELGDFEVLWPALQVRWDTPLRPEAWSPAQVVEHVIKTNASFSKTLHVLQRDAPLPERPAPKGILKDGRPQAPEGLQPGEPQALSVLEPLWQEVNARLLHEVETIKDWHGRTLPHPFLGELDAFGWLRAAAWHIAHHRRGLEAAGENA